MSIMNLVKMTERFESAEILRVQSDRGRKELKP